jgi:HAD superfamily hydrolase (TIGR01509 family)
MSRALPMRVAALRAVLLDLDGTLVDSNDAHAMAWLEALTDAGYVADFSHIRRLIGKGGDKLLPEVTGLSTDSALATEITKQRARIFQSKYLPQVRAFPRADELLKRMRADDLRLVVATSAKERELGPLLELCGATGLLYEKTDSDDAKHSKPDPDIVKNALMKAGCEPHEALMLGDTPYDLEASRKAGVKLIGMRCGGWDDESLHGAAAIYDSPSDLLTHYARSLLVARSPA